jgi:uncharacterized damage-inducible protein DinB
MMEGARSAERRRDVGNVHARLMAHMHWGDEAVLESLRQPEATAEALERMAHVLGAEEVWLARLEQRDPTLAVWPRLDLAGCASALTSARVKWKAYLDALTPERLAKPVPYSNSAGKAFTTRVDDILLHVALHGAHHRAQIGTLLRQAGATPAPIDYIGYARGSPAATRSDSPRR